MVFKIGQFVKFKRSNGNIIEAQIIEIFDNKLKLSWDIDGKKGFKLVNYKDILNEPTSFQLKCLKNYLKLIIPLILLAIFVKGVLYEHARSIKVKY